MLFRKLTLCFALSTYCVTSNAYEWADDTDNLVALTAVAYAASELIDEQLNKIEGNDALQKASISLETSNIQVFDYYSASHLTLAGEMPIFKSSFLKGSFSRKKAFFRTESEKTLFGTNVVSLATKKEVGIGTKLNKDLTINFSHSKNTDDQPLTFFSSFSSATNNNSDYDRNSLSFSFNTEAFTFDAGFSKASGKRAVQDIWNEVGILYSNINWLDMRLDSFGSHDYKDTQKRLRITYKPYDSLKLWAERSRTNYQQRILQLNTNGYVFFPNFNCSASLLYLPFNCATPQSTTYATYDYSYEATKLGAHYLVTPEWEVNLEHLSTDRIPANYFSTSYKLNKKAELSISYDSYNEFLGTGFKLKFN